MITLIKLIDGTEIVGSVSINDTQDITVDNPLQINYFIKTPASMPIVSLHRYMPFSNNNSFIFCKDHVIAQSDPMPGMKEYYTTTLKEISEYMDSELNLSLYGKVEAITEDGDDVTKALLERALLKPTLN